MNLLTRHGLAGLAAVVQGHSIAIFYGTPFATKIPPRVCVYKIDSLNDFVIDFLNDFVIDFTIDFLNDFIID